MGATYEYIATKIESLKSDYSSLRSRPDDYVFSALCVEVNFYKDPALVLNESDFANIIVDGKADGGADILLTDPGSENSDLVIGQAKFRKTISQETVINAMLKMARFYHDMKAGHYERVNAHVQSRFLALDAERSDEAKVHFVFYTSAPQKGIKKDEIESNFLAQFTELDKIEVSILFAEDIKNEIDEWNSRKPTVERGSIQIDDKDNYLLYGDEAVVVNASAFSIKKLYGEYNIGLLSRNLRYHIKGGKLDKKIRDTINKNPESFWLKNNGITIICDNFVIDGCEVKLWNFSIVNGGQTTYLLNKSNITEKKDFWLTCKIIKTIGETEDEKVAFSLEIAEAANSQKAIKPADLRANAPEQRRFATVMLEVGIFYQTKRGEEILKPFRDDDYRHTKLEEVGKLCLAAIFQEPCKSRTNPSAAYKDERYYTPIFNGNQKQIAAVCKELLYIDYYFRKKFQPAFERNNEDMPDAADRLPFASNARTICIAFAALAARYYQGNLTDKDVTALTSAQNDSDANSSYKTLRDLGDMKFLLPMKLQTDTYDATLDKLFETIIDEGAAIFSDAHESNSNLAAANFLKSDKNYYKILKRRWSTLRRAIKEIFSEAQNAN